MKRFLFFAVAAVLFAACSKDAIDEQQGIQNIVDEAPETLTVGFEDDETRIQLNEDVKTVWTKGDLVSVFYRSDANQQWQYTGETGARTGSLKRVSTTDATTKLPKVVVVYPYNESYYINPVSCNIEATMPAEQTYLKDSYGLDGNIMVSSDEFNQISLKSVYGWLKLQLTGNGEQIKSITVRGNSGEQMAGLVYIDSSDATTTLAAEMGSADDPDVGGAGGNLVFEDTVLKEVTLNCLDGTSPTEKGVALGVEATAFYIALPPQTFTKGITVEITDTTNFTMTQSTDKEVVIERNHIKPMAAFEVALNAAKPANNEIWYTNGSTTEPTAPNKPAAFGSATIQSNSYDAEKECWVITFDKEVTEIGDSAFCGYNNDCVKLTSITIPDSVTTIGEEAISFCINLTSVNIPNSVTTIGDEAFLHCDSLTSVTIPDSVTTIGVSAFLCCYSLTSVTIPDSVTTIGKEAFYFCDSLTSVTIPDSVTTIGESAFVGCDSLKEFKGKFAADGGRCLIMDNTIIAYANASGTTYTIPDSVATIGAGAFYFCDSLTSVTIPDSVTTIGGAAFRYCFNLTSMTIPDGVTTIGGFAFSDCESLTSVTIGNGVTTIGDLAFHYCTSLKEFKGKFAADGGRCLIIDGVLNAFAIGCGVTQYTIPDSVTTIGYRAFYSCDSLTSVTIGNSVTTIGVGAFSSCESLTSATIGDSVTTIGWSAFGYCDSLTSVTIPDSVTTIGEGAFYKCTSLKTVYCKPTTPPAGSNDMFDNNAAGRSIYVPAGSGANYKEKQYWSEYKDYIFEEE